MTFPSDTSLLKAIAQRHSVRRYLETPVSQEIIECLKTEIGRINSVFGMSMKLVTGEPTAFSGPLARYGKFSGVRNYIIVSAPAGKGFSELCGREGERLVLGMQAMGLSSCWVGLSYRKTTDDFKVPAGHKIRCVIAFGYGAEPGSSHKIKALEDVSNVTPESPEWMRRGVRAALLAPTAVNQQKFYFRLGNDGRVTATPRFSLVGYTLVDLGIAVCHFNLAVGSGHKI